jgi:hypothetical protein
MAYVLELLGHVILRFQVDLGGNYLEVFEIS